MITKYIDAAIQISAGVFATLIGFRFLGPKPGTSSKFDAMQTKWLYHLKWLGPVMIIISIANLLLYSRDINSAEHYEAEKQQKVQTMQDSVSHDGKLAETDQIVSSLDGFKVLVPQGFTFLKPIGTSIALIANYDAKREATPGFSVAIIKSGDTLENTIENMKNILIARNSTYRFTQTKKAKFGAENGYRMFVTSEQNGITVRGGGAFFASGDSVFMLIYGTRIDLYDKSEPVLERVVSSFSPI